MNEKQQQRTQQSSLYATQVMQSMDGIWQQDYAKDQFLTALSQQDIQQLLQDTLSDVQDEVTWMRCIRQLRARLMLRWIWQDCNGLTDVISLTQQLSYFADACIVAAKDFARPALVAKHGEPIGADGTVQDLVVIAMGKHGAEELNLSSDIDLIFCFAQNGETNGRKCIDVQQFCIFWGQKIIYLLDHVTADGFVFRVDMRLRPWGDGSALALSYAALEKYLIQHGREWERYAWIKARAITGGTAGEEIIRLSRSFVFRRYVDYTAFAAMREMKGMINKEVARRNTADDVKLGAGGIREIEFIVQVFQLIYGGSHLKLQDRQCLIALKHLYDDHFLDQTAHDELRTAYLYLRRVEHAIQALQDQQTQNLPQENELRLRLIYALNFDTWQAFMDDLNIHRNKVSHYFKHLIEQPMNQEQLENQSFEMLSEELAMILDDETKARIERFWHSQTVQHLPSTAEQRLRKFWPLFSQAIVQADRPQAALLRLLPLLESILRRSVYLVMLTENRGALQRLVKMASSSPWICEELVQYPVLLDEFLSLDFEFPQREDLQQNLRQQLLRLELNDVEDIMRVLRLFKKSNVLAVAASDILAESPLMRVSDVLTDIAEISVNATLNLAFQMTAQRYGVPVKNNGERASLDQIGMAVVGYGKLGGIELGYGSDLDLVFLHDYQDYTETDSKKAISGMEFAMRCTQKFMSLMTTQTLDGRVYEVDTRLRPNGDAGVLVSSLKQFEQYQYQHAWLWEHQALVRARSVAGDADLCQKFEQIRCAVLTQQRELADVKQQVLEMREKMLNHLGSKAHESQAGIFHLKHDRGGIVDIEFMAQFLVLAFSHQDAQLAHYSDNVRIFQDAASAGMISLDDADLLIMAYLLERGESHRLALDNQSLRVQAEAWQVTREQVCAIWEQLFH
ncbi:bifunctional [glutamate--ammonia ligase]-adenylyl-L-tyrosine phosphorylase/[glutamate--ammonia-ligase] adenylyltransferase [Acinetobacter sp. c1-l78]|uniref:bifunctional [glutamate--ammonia ligase]-adenylyl-L-tyrosine phosphorylase/[glutamate--ammonia-ligase] adenylyltransferase n=1 Tax=Acinetobacter sp. c1-l78 TaxID=3342803 RepID=UPI0035BA806C